MFARMKCHIRLIAIVAVVTVLSGTFLVEPVAYAQGGEDDYVDVAVILEVPDQHSSVISRKLNIIVVNNGARTAYDVEVVVDIEYPVDTGYYTSGRVDGVIEVPVGSASLENDDRSLRWSIPALGGYSVKRLARQG